MPSPSFESNARNVSLLTFVSRLTGLARDAALSRVFGAGFLMDAFFFAFMVPNLFRRLFGEGALAAAFLPVYAELDRDDPETAKRLASMTVSLLVTLLGVVVLAGELVLVLISGATGHTKDAVWLMMITLPYMPLVCVVAMLGAMLQVHNRFGPTAAAPIILNLLIVATTIGLAFVFDYDDFNALRTHIALVAGSIVVAGVLQVAWSMIALRRQQWWRGDFRTPLVGRHMKRVMRQMGPMIVGLGVLQLNTFFDGIIASYPVTVGGTIFGVEYPLDAGAMSAVSYAQRLYQFPLGVFGIAIATAIFPLLARLNDNDVSFRAVIERGLRLVVYIGLPASVGLILVREPLTAVILQGGEFDSRDTARVSWVLLGYAPAIWAYSMVHVLTRAFYARGDSKTPVRIAVSVVALNLALNCGLIWTPLRESALAWSTAACSVVQVVLLLATLRKRERIHVRGAVWRSWALSAAATLVMGGLVAACGLSMGASETWSQHLLALAAMVATGAIAYFVVSRALRMPELNWALGRGINTKRTEG